MCEAQLFFWPVSSNLGMPVDKVIIIDQLKRQVTKQSKNV